MTAYTEYHDLLDLIYQSICMTAYTEYHESLDLIYQSI